MVIAHVQCPFDESVPQMLQNIKREVVVTNYLSKINSNQVKQIFRTVAV